MRPPVFEDAVETQTARWLNLIFWGFLFAGLSTALLYPVLVNPERAAVIFGAMIVMGVLGQILIRQGYVTLAAALSTGMMWLLAVFVTLFSGGFYSPALLGFMLSLILAALFLRTGGLLTVACATCLFAVALWAVERAGVLPVPWLLVTPVGAVLVLLNSTILGALLLYVALNALRARLVSVQEDAAELVQQRAQLEEQVAERTQVLTRRASYLEATTQVAREAAHLLDEPEQLLARVAEMISEQLGFYHTGIFLLDETGAWAVLRAASSEGGHTMLQHGHRLRVGEQGIVGFVTRRGRSRIALDVAEAEEAVYFNNPYLPLTRSEIALPLRARGSIIGALDVQSTEPGAFDEEDAAVLQGLADQVAVAISNARLFQQLQETAEAERRARGEMTREAWLRFLQSEGEFTVRSTPQEVAARLEAPASSEVSPVRSQALREAQMAVDEGAGTRLAIPLKVAGQVVGVVEGRKPEEAGAWSSEEMVIMDTLIQQLNSAVERARLYRETQRIAARQRTIAEVGARMRASLDVEALLRTATAEMREALGLRDLVVKLAPMDIFASAAEEAAGTPRVADNADIAVTE